MYRKLTVLAVLMMLWGTSVYSQTTVEWWQFWTDPESKQAIESIVADFEAANPDIKIRLTDLTWANGHEKIVIALASGTGPDILELGSDWIAQFAEGGQLADLSSDIKDDSTSLQGWGLSTYKGNVYGVPWILGTRVVFVNQELTGRTVLTDQWVPAKWRHLQFLADSLCLPGADVYAWGSNAPEKHRLYKKFLPFFWTVGGQVFTDDHRYCVISSLWGILALEMYKMLHDDCAYVADQRGLEDAFLDNKVAIIMSGDWFLKRIKLEKPNLKFATTVIPSIRMPSGVKQGISFLGGEFLAVNEASENKDAALKFIRFLTSPENEVRFCKASGSASPASRAAQEDSYFQSDPNLQTFIEQLKSAKHPPVDPDWVHIEDIIEEAIEAAVFSEELTPAEALREAQIKITELKKKR